MSNFRSPIRTIQTDWRAGEIDEMFMMRVDSKAYPSGAKTLRNMLLHSTGATSRRPGTLTKAALAGRSRLIDFEFDANEKYVCAFRNAAVDIYDAAGTLLQTIGSASWNATTMWEINFVQKGDVMIIVHPSFRMKDLRRTSLSTFTLTDVVFSTDTGALVYNQPHLKFHVATVTLGISDYNIGAGRTLTSNAAIFSAACVGDRYRIFNCEIEVTGFTNSTTVTVTVHQKVRKRLDPAPFRYDDDTTIVEVTHALHGLATGDTVNISGATDFDTVLESEVNGNRVITVVDRDRYTVVCGGTPPGISGDGGGPAVFISTTGQTRDWTEQAWSNRRGWPGAICLHENRIWMGGSTGAPTFLAGSTVGAYYDFNIGDGFDDESLQGQISALSRILHLVSAKQLQIFTEDGEAVVETEQGMPITPGGFKVIQHTTYGASLSIRPMVFDGATLFTQRSGKNVREFSYDFNTDSHVATAVSILASHMILSPYDMAVLLGTGTRPEQYAFFVNANGTVACFHSIRNESLAAWTQFVTGGGDRFDSVCVIGTSVFFSVLRDGVYYLERLELDSDDIWLDGAVLPTAGGPTTAWSLGTRFANKTVSVMTRYSGHYLGDYLADAAGDIVLPTAVVSIVAGYHYGVTVVPLPPDKELQDGPMTGEIRRIVSSTIHFHQSTSAAVNGNEMLGFTIGQDPSLPPARITAKKRIRMLGYGRDPQIAITQPAPGPLTVLGLSMEVSL